mmetsp:Transcript_30896/g.47363  ORF Transcript_30896/g.47363 Transcript_30896/m.47363 type:complete len:187 (-) Transcript_30896:164-724(-)|eukprot:CAMPEP_0118688540 /NCGR_PEP_ID=MMETSP0800-20121206/8979_1 /TAXON_ID=210618 ORGANISM="Striatella unipunctata, Strain CCMP2910" /NCGR_SAMPLE_ID=MMETSP0800 /ASSEMBLY_ACC=CAM_ASM_000638 /LENGTH=186 /DNA_ID=CAMNT_0006585815 /DNA_START=157 /DNA_END=717 /DNA_ORIENTATION=-
MAKDSSIVSGHFLALPNLTQESSPSEFLRRHMMRHLKPCTLQRSKSMPAPTRRKRTSSALFSSSKSSSLSTSTRRTQIIAVAANIPIQGPQGPYPLPKSPVHDPSRGHDYLMTSTSPPRYSNKLMTPILREESSLKADVAVAGIRLTSRMLQWEDKHMGRTLPRSQTMMPSIEDDGELLGLSFIED